MCQAITIIFTEPDLLLNKTTKPVNMSYDVYIIIKLYSNTLCNIYKQIPKQIGNTRITVLFIYGNGFWIKKSILRILTLQKNYRQLHWVL